MKIIAPKGRTALGGGSGGGARASGGKKKPFSGGSGVGSGRGSSTSALGSIQVNVTLDSLHAAYEEDEAMTRLLARGKALATAIVAATKATSAPVHADYVMRDIE
jgi:glutamate-1-semialdehyde aminotransferase